ncbi:MAG: DUF2249 domain-containing protein [Nakamurella sp.]
MTTTIASTTIDGAVTTEATALDAITQHHAQLLGTVIAHATALLDASSAGSLEGASSTRRDLVLFCRSELLPHSIAEEDTIYALARQLPGTKALVDAMIADHRAIAELIDDLAGATTPLGASAAAYALRVVFELHVEKDGDYILPAIAASDDVSLVDGLVQLQALTDELSSAAQGGGGCCGGGGEGGGCGCSGGSAESARAVSEPVQASGGCGGGGGGGCGCSDGAAEAAAPAQTSGGCGGGGGCGCSDNASETGYDADSGVAPSAAPSRPVLDARQVPHNIRHATVFGALDAVRPGTGLELIAPHDPLPLLAQIEERDPGAFDVSYLERGPEAWRIALDRRVPVNA